MLKSGFWKAKILKSAIMLNSGILESLNLKMGQNL